MTKETIFQHISKDHILQAISRIDKEGYSAKRKSSSYNLVYNDKCYPPKYVTSLASYFANGDFLTHDQFGGGDNSECFGFLRSYGFEILTKEASEHFLDAKSVPTLVQRKYVNRYRRYDLDESLFTITFQKYLNQCNNTDWLLELEAYKFRFGRWLTSRIDFNTQSDQEIFDIIQESQNNEYTPGDKEKGINFVKAITRFNDNFISIEDIATLRKMRNGYLIEEWDLKDTYSTWPVFSVWAGLLIPNKYKIIAKGELMQGFVYLYNLGSPIVSQVRGFNLMNTYLNHLSEVIKSRYANELTSLLAKIFEEDTDLLPSDLAWFTQDYMFFLTREIIDKVPSYYWVNQGKQFKNELENSCICASSNSKKHHHKRLKDLKVGDILIHYADKAIQATSIVKETFKKKPRPYLDTDVNDLMVMTDYTILDQPIPISTIQERLRQHLSILPKVNSPFNKNLGVVQSYCLMFNKSSFDIIFDKSNNTITKANMEYPLNQILYGPPGTGKTYATVGMAVKIANPEFNASDQMSIKQEFQRLISEGKIAFTTFHQSLGYEEFVEGIKPKVLEEESNSISYEVQPGIFQKMAIDAAFDMVKDLESSKVKGIVGFTEKYDHLVSTLEEQLSSKSKVTIPSKSGGELIVADISSQRNILLKHHDDGQSYVVSKNRMKKLHTAFPDLSVLKNIDKEFRQVIGGSNSSAYWAVLNAISEIDSITELGPLDENEPIDFEAKREIVQEADPSKFQFTPKQNYVLIIDEINRGNVSKIFGELITLIEESKRLGRPDYLKATLPYSSSGNDVSITFGVPPNLYIIGTMNTADRSVEALDTALRRRFSFTEIMPNPSILDTGEHNGVQKLFGHDLSKMLSTINDRIEVLLDRDHTIGHSYFMNLKDEADLIKVFTDNIIPLMQEYFYNDYSKIEMVMGSGFIGSTRNNADLRFAKTTNNIDIDLPDFSYHLISIDNNNIQKAIDLMMNIVAT